MKIVLFTIPLIALAVVAVAQGQTEYFDKSWQAVSDKNKASYYRVLQYTSKDSSTGWVQYHYITGQLEREGKISGIDKNGQEIIQGWCTWYHANGRKSRLSYFSGGSLDSATYYWNEDGYLDRVLHYQNNILQGDWVCYNPAGTIKFLAVYQKGKIKKLTFYEKDKIKVINAYLKYDDEWDYNSFIFRDDFADNCNNWILEKDAKAIIEMLPGKLAIKSETDTVLSSHIYYPLPNDYDFSLETEVSFMRGANNTGHGIIWGFQDWDNYDYFLITARGYFKTGAVIEGKDIVSNNWMRNNGIYKGRSINHLKVIKEQDTYVFLANNKKLGISNFIKMAGDSLGVFNRGGKKSVSFSNLQVRTHFGVSNLNPSENRSVPVLAPSPVRREQD